MLEMLKWAGLAGLVVSVSASALCGLGLAWLAWRQREAGATARRAAKEYVRRFLARELAPILKRIHDQELQLELLAAYAAEARRHARPNLSIARTAEEPLDAA